MAEHMRNSQNRSNKFYGTLVSTGMENVKLTGIGLPELSDRYFTLRRSDFAGDCVLSVFDGTIPVLSEEKILYPQQAVMALFGPDNESVKLLARQVTFDTAELEKDNSLALEEGMSDELGMGSEVEDRSELRRVDSSMHSASVQYESPVLMVCECWQEGERLHIEVPTQWPALIRRNVAALLSCPEANVVVHQMPCQSRHDEYLIPPAIYAYVGAMATMKAGLPVVLTGHAYAVTPDIRIERSTYCSEDGHPVCEECRMTASLGAFSIADEEFIRQSLTGLIPNYPLTHFHASVEVRRSSTFPSVFNDGAGYPEALASSERQANAIADAFETPPPLWRRLVCTSRRPFTDHIPSIDLAQLVSLGDDIIDECDFNRKWASYSTQRDDYSLLSFNRGVGMAMGVSIAGFSTSMAKDFGAQARITLTEKKNLTLLTSFPSDGAFDALVSKVVASEVDLEDEKDVIILDNDGTATDSGPDMLQRRMGHFPVQLANACARLNLERKDAALPLSIVFDTDEKLMPCEFEPRGMAWVIVETRLDDISFTPTVLDVWVSVMVDANMPEKDLALSVRRQVVSTLVECGATPSTFAQHPFGVHIRRVDSLSGGVTSIDAAMKGLVKAAFQDSVRMCMSLVGDELPLTSAAIDKAYRAKEDEQ